MMGRIITLINRNLTNDLVRWGGLAVLCSLVSGCDPPNNTRWFEKDNVRLSARIGWGKPGVYDSIQAGTPRSPLTAQKPPIQLELPNGEVVELAELTVDYLEEHGRRITDAGGGKWPEGAKRIYFSGYSFIVHVDRIQSVWVRLIGLDEEEWRPAVGKVGADDLYRLPLTHDQAVEIFGPPDRIRDFYHH